MFFFGFQRRWLGQPSLLDDGSVETSGTGLDGTRHWSNWRTDPDVAFRRQKRTGGCLGMSSSCENKFNIGSYRYRDCPVIWSYFYLLLSYVGGAFNAILAHYLLSLFYCSFLFFFRLFWCQITTALYGSVIFLLTCIPQHITMLPLKITTKIRETKIVPIKTQQTPSSLMNIHPFKSRPGNPTSSRPWSSGQPRR